MVIYTPNYNNFGYEIEEYLVPLVLKWPTWAKCHMPIFQSPVHPHNLSKKTVSRTFFMLSHFTLTYFQILILQNVPGDRKMDSDGWKVKVALQD